MSERVFQSAGWQETQRVAADLALTLVPGSVIALHGPLGAGKTCFVQGLADGLGVSVPVSSPTYTLVNEYPGRLLLSHVDLYRLNDPVEVLEMGLEEILEGGGVTAIEWAERVDGYLPGRTLHVSLVRGESPDHRDITICTGEGHALSGD